MIMIENFVLISLFLFLFLTLHISFLVFLTVIICDSYREHGVVEQMALYVLSGSALTHSGAFYSGMAIAHRGSSDS